MKRVAFRTTTTGTGTIDDPFRSRVPDIIRRRAHYMIEIDMGGGVKRVVAWLTDADAATLQADGRFTILGIREGNLREWLQDQMTDD